VFDTVSSTWVAADKGSFSCDKASGYYLSPKYYFDKQSGWYKIIPPAAVASATQADNNLITAPNVVHTALGDLQVGSKDYEVAKALGLLSSSDGIVLSGTGAGSNNQAQSSSSGQTWLDLTNLVNVINTLQSTATSGDVNATANTQVGDAVTGAASVIANIFNLLASAWSWSNGNLNFFMQTLCKINETCEGKTLLNPTQVQNGGGGSIGGSANIDGTGAGSNNTINGDATATLDVNAKNEGNIVNNVDVNAQSGDASANKNTLIGDVASGEAMAQVNIINLINSFINSGNSFFGILNIFGTLNGDILFPEGFLNGAVSSGTNGGTNASLGTTGADSNNQASLNASSEANISNSAYNGVNNNIQTTAQSGSANVGANTQLGDVGTGSATTTQGLFNLSNSSIFGDNAVLVIVNVLGHWVGKIMSVPGGGATQSALLTGNAQVGVNNTGADSNNQINGNTNETANINQSSVGTITNNVNVNAQSGDASANKNTKVGDVSTGDAKASSGVANIFNTILNMKHWFGVLVINVFGDWVGDVNEDSGAAANTTFKPASVQPGTVNGVPAGALPKVGIAGLFISGASSQASSGNVAGADTRVSGGNNTVLTAAAHQSAPAKVAAVKGADMSVLFGLSALVMLVAGALFSAERKLNRR
jgi:hypothetical protein